MAQTEIANAQLVPHLAPFVAGAGWDQPFIGEQVLPPTNTYAQSFRYETYNNAGLVDQGGTKRGRHSGSKILTPPVNGTVDAFLEEASAKIPLDINDINAAEVADRLRPAAADGVLSSADRLRVGRMRIIAFNNSIQKEKDVANLVFTDTNYEDDLKTSALSYKTCTITDITDRMREVQKKFGFLPDTWVLGYKARAALNDNAKFLDRINGGATASQPAVVTDQLLASLVGVKRVLVGMSITQTLSAAGKVGTPTPLWTEDAAALIYSGTFEQSDLASPAYGKVFYMNVPETGIRYATWNWLDPEPNTIEWQKAAEYFLVRQVMKAGYHFTNVDQ